MTNYEHEHSAQNPELVSSSTERITGSEQPKGHINVPRTMMEHWRLKTSELLNDEDEEVREDFEDWLLAYGHVQKLPKGLSDGCTSSTDLATLTSDYQEAVKYVQTLLYNHEDSDLEEALFSNQPVLQYAALTVALEVDYRKNVVEEVFDNIVYNNWQERKLLDLLQTWISLSTKEGKSDFGENMHLLVEYTQKQILLPDNKEQHTVDSEKYTTIMADAFYHSFKAGHFLSPQFYIQSISLSVPLMLKTLYERAFADGEHRALGLYMGRYEEEVAEIYDAHLSFASIEDIKEYASAKPLHWVLPRKMMHPTAGKLKFILALDTEHYRWVFHAGDVKIYPYHKELLKELEEYSATCPKEFLSGGLIDVDDGVVHIGGKSEEFGKYNQSQLIEEKLELKKYLEKVLNEKIVRIEIGASC